MVLYKQYLHIRCVSETVHGNFIPKVNRSIHYLIAPYPGPFILIPPQKRKEKKNVILFAHRFIPPKNPILFAEVILELFNEKLLGDWIVKMRGNGALESEIRTILRPLIDRGQAFVGYNNELIEDQKTAKIFVSIIETGNYPSNSLFESMRCGNLLVLSDRGVTKEKIGVERGIYYIENLCREEVKLGVLEAMDKANSQDFKEFSYLIEKRYEDIAEASGYLKEVDRIYNGL